MSEPTEILGGCLCKSVRYRITAEPITTRLCWCRVCQYLAAGNATVNVVVRSDSISITGELRDYRNVADSGNVMHRRFCPACGTPLFSAAEARPHLVIVRAGTLDNPHLIKPTIAIWTNSAPSWACFDPGITQIPGQPPPT